MAWLWCSACIIFHLVVYWLEVTVQWWIGETLLGILVMKREDDYRGLILRQEWRWSFQQQLIILLSITKLVLDAWQGRFFRSPHLSFREAFPLHRFEVIFDHPQILFQCVVSNDALSEVESKIFRYCDAFLWKNGLTLLANFHKSALEPCSGDVTYQNTYGSWNRPDCGTVITARQEYPEREFVSSGAGLMVSDLEAGLLQKPAEGAQQAQPIQLEDSPTIEECAEEAETPLWDLSGMGDRGLNEQVNPQKLTEDLDEQNLYQEPSEGNLRLQFKDAMRRSEEACERAEQASESENAALEELVAQLQDTSNAREQHLSSLENTVKGLRAQLQDLTATLEQGKGEIQNLRSQSQTKTQELITEKHRADAAEQELIKLQREQDRCIESRRILSMRLNDAKEDKNKQQQEYEDVMNDLTTQQKEERCQMIAKIKHEYEAIIEDVTAKLDLANTMADEKQVTINQLKSLLKRHTPAEIMQYHY